VGDLVLIADKPHCRGHWPMGLVEEVFNDDRERCALPGLGL